MKRFILFVVILLEITAGFLIQDAKAQKGERGFKDATLTKEQERFAVQKYREVNRESVRHYYETSRQFDGEAHLINIARVSILINYHKGAAFAFAFLGQKQEQKGQYDSCLFYLKNALHHSVNMVPNTGMTAKLYAMIGVLYGELSKHDSSCLYMYKGLENLELGTLNLNDEQVVSNAYQVYRTIGAFWNDLNNMDNALFYLTRASNMVKLSKDQRLYHDALVSKGTIYFRKNVLDSAIACYTALLKDSSVKPTIRVLANENMARIFLKMPDEQFQKKALPYLSEALQLSQKYHYNMLKLRVESLLAAHYYLVKDYRKAELLFTSIVNDTSRKSIGLAELSLQHENLSKLYENLGKYKQAFIQMQQVAVLRKKLIYQDETYNINGFEAKYRASEKDRLLAQKALQVSKQQKQLEHQYVLLIGGGSFALLIIFALILLLRVSKQKDEIEKLKAIMYGEEKERTRMARELHDGTVSNLSAIRLNLSALPLHHPGMQYAMEDLQKSLVLLDQNIAELRNTSHNLLPEPLNQSGLAEAIRIYASNITGLGHLEIKFVLIGQLPMLNKDFQLSVYRIIQELINNIIKHAHATYIFIQFQVLREQLNIAVEDNGDGIPFFHLESTNGIGLQNLKNRIKALNGTIEIESNKGTSVYLTFNLQPFIEKLRKTAH